MPTHAINRIGASVFTGLLAASLITTTACVRFPVQLQDATSHLEGTKSFESLGPAEGKACQFNLFYLIPFGGNQLWKAKERAIGDADGLTDVSVDSSIGLAIIGTVACTEVRGVRYRLVEAPDSFVDPAIIPEAPPPEELVPDEPPVEPPAINEEQDALEGGDGLQEEPADALEHAAEDEAVSEPQDDESVSGTDETVEGPTP